MIRLIVIAILLVLILCLASQRLAIVTGQVAPTPTPEVRLYLGLLMRNSSSIAYPTMTPLPTAQCSPAGVCGTMPYPVYELGPDDPYWCTVVLAPSVDPCQQTWLPVVVRK